MRGGQGNWKQSNGRVILMAGEDFTLGGFTYKSSPSAV